MIGLGILKQTSANLIDVTDGVKEEFLKIKENLPKNIKIYQSYDTSLFVSEALNEVIFTLCFAIILVTIIILNFSSKYKNDNYSILNCSNFYFINIYFFKSFWIYY